MSKESFDAAVRAYSEANKGFQAIAAEITDYSKKAFEDATRAFEQWAFAIARSRPDPHGRMDT